MRTHQEKIDIAHTQEKIDIARIIDLTQYSPSPFS